MNQTPSDIAVIKVRLPEGCGDMTIQQIAGVVSGYILNGLEIISIEVETEDYS